MLNIAIILSWFACLATYLSSDKQSLLSKPLPKGKTWVLSSLALGLACYFAAGVYSAATAFIYVLSLVMLSWIAIVLLRAHWRFSSTAFGISGAAILLVILNLGNL